MVSFGVCSIIPIATTLEQVSALQPNEMELNQYSTSQVAEQCLNGANETINDRSGTNVLYKYGPKTKAWRGTGTTTHLPKRTRELPRVVNTVALTVNNGREAGRDSVWDPRQLGLDWGLGLGISFRYSSSI
ncbi:hypothetical protein LXG23DRAFT_38462 [Yarrowia lipolytica]|nr:hypothetical protein BKA91DRAFT_168978 [Yarrowia lipolytica]KAE8169686.1 hypothetical protein BKA90DRAFT_170791 [Yarrowia lipolytica]KAJ8052408.1 hypothetical protein LXG23DRAFT_38462 [Yarrowia lipolytica]RMJ01146.1 hypothetical protein BD777DRAFT_150454 [Yarrowia lipolytica]